MRWLNDITDSVDMGLRKLELHKPRKPRRANSHQKPEETKSNTPYSHQKRVLLTP